MCCRSEKGETVSRIGPEPLLVCFGNGHTDRIGKSRIWTMMLVDDIVICSESKGQVNKNQEMWRFELAKEKKGMKLRSSKKEYMFVNEREAKSP